MPPRGFFIVNRVVRRQLEAVGQRGHGEAERGIAVQKSLPVFHGLRFQAVLLHKTEHGFTAAEAFGAQQNPALKVCLKGLQRLQRHFGLAVYRHIGQGVGGAVKFGHNLRIGFQMA